MAVIYPRCLYFSPSQNLPFLLSFSPSHVERAFWKESHHPSPSPSGEGERGFDRSRFPRTSGSNEAPACPAAMKPPQGLTPGWSWDPRTGRVEEVKAERGKKNQGVVGRKERWPERRASQSDVDSRGMTDEGWGSEGTPGQAQGKILSLTISTPVPDAAKVTRASNASLTSAWGHKSLLHWPPEAPQDPPGLP